MRIAAGIGTLALALALVCQAGEDWTVAPGTQALRLSNVVPNSPVLVKSLGDAAEMVKRWKLPPDAEAWRARRPVVERAFRQAIGLETLPERTPLQAGITARHDLGGYLLENVIFESRPGFPVTANLYRPKAPATGKRPAVLCPIGHYLAEGKTHRDVQSRCIKLAQMGFVVLVYDAIGHGERMLAGNIHHEAGYALLPLGETVAGWMVWDSMRGIDYLVSRADVDPDRIGVTGNSGGGLNTLFTAALDERARAATVVGYTFEFNNWLKYAGAHCTCTHLPGLFRSMEWFEIAGLIAPRALMMIQGGNDGIFPISGARRAGRNTEALYAMLGQAGRVRFVEVPGQPHAYSRPYREPMYGWMARQLAGEGTGDPVAEGDVQPLDDKDPRLLCDPARAIVSRAPTVVDLAREKAVAAVAGLAGDRAAVARWVRDLTAAPESHPHYLAPGGAKEKVSFNSEDGQYIPGLLWLPEKRPAPAIVLVDSRGKRAVAESGLVQPLVGAGFAVFAVDLRGRGETLDQIRPGYDINFRLVANQVLSGAPLAGRRAFDLTRALDYLALRQEVKPDGVTVVGLGDDALPALVAAARDARISQLALAGYLHSFVSQMRIMKPPASGDLRRTWNDPQLDGRIKTDDYEVDFGSVIPSALKTADIPDLASLIAPRRVLFCQARDAALERFRRVADKGQLEYAPDQALDAARLLAWLRKGETPREKIRALMHRVNDWQQAHPVMPPDDRNWERATWYTGVTAAWKATGDGRFLDQAVEWGQRHAWQVGTERLGSNRLFCSQTWLEVYFARKDRAMIEPTIRWLATEAPNSPPAPRWHVDRSYSYVDALYGAPIFAMLAKATGDTRYLATMHAFFEEVTGELFDRESGLYYRDTRYIGKRTANGKKVFWSRGNGWAFAGIAHVLDYLLPDDPRRPRYLEVFRRMAAELVKRQGADGYWRPNLDDPDDIALPETSGTGFFCFGLAWGINHGILDRAQFLPVVERAWEALTRSVTAEGKVQWGQQVDAAPNPLKQESTHEYVTGTFLLAASEMYRLAGE